MLMEFISKTWDFGTLCIDKESKGNSRFSRAKFKKVLNK